MGLVSNGKKASDIFKPYAYVTRAQFAVILSRILYGETYNTTDTKNRYVPHMNKLKTEGIMQSLSDPFALTLRGHAFLMFKRTNELLNVHLSP